MNTIDIFGVIFVIISMIVFWKKGLLSFAFPIVAIVLSLWLSFNNSAMINNIFGERFKEMAVKIPILSYVVSFIIYAIILTLVFYIIKNFVRMTLLKVFDSILGAIFGFVLATVLIMVVLYIMLKIGKSSSKLVENSTIFYPIFRGFLSS
ncbi:CvpA family protein [bacterium]|nr:CvpA family protein [bacterium]